MRWAKELLVAQVWTDKCIHVPYKEGNGLPSKVLIKESARKGIKILNAPVHVFGGVKLAAIKASRDFFCKEHIACISRIADPNFDAHCCANAINHLSAGNNIRSINRAGSPEECESNRRVHVQRMSADHFFAACAIHLRNSLSENPPSGGCRRSSPTRTATISRLGIT